MQASKAYLCRCPRCTYGGVLGIPMQASQVYLCRCPRCTYVGVLGIPMQVSQVYLCRCPSCTYVGVLIIPMQVSQVYLCRCPKYTYVGVLIIPMQVSQVYLYRCPRYILYHGRQVSAAISTSTTTTTTNINCSGEKFYSEQEFCDCDVIRISFNHLFQFKEAGLKVTFITPYPTVNLHYPPTQSDLYNLRIQKRYYFYF